MDDMKFLAFNVAYCRVEGNITNKYFDFTDFFSYR